MSLEHLSFFLLFIIFLLPILPLFLSIITLPMSLLCGQAGSLHVVAKIDSSTYELKSQRRDHLPGLGIQNDMSNDWDFLGLLAYPNSIK